MTLEQMQKEGNDFLHDKVVHPCLYSERNGDPKPKDIQDAIDQHTANTWKAAYEAGYQQGYDEAY